MNARHFLLIAALLVGLDRTPVAARLVAAYSGAQGVVSSTQDILIRASDMSQADMHGGWTLAADPTACDGIKLTAWYADDGTSALDAPLAAPADFVDVSFEAPAGTPYRVWLRLNSPDAGGDSVWLQFSDATVDGERAYAIHTATGLLVSMHPCAGCTTSGWGWRDTSWGLRQPSLVRFATAGPHTLRIQPRAPGVQIDQIVLSPGTYLDRAPGAPQDDVTVLRKR